jgi:hypothetical protein
MISTLPFISILHVANWWRIKNGEAATSHCKPPHIRLLMNQQCFLVMLSKQEKFCLAATANLSTGFFSRIFNLGSNKMIGGAGQTGTQ